ncbi:MAG: T9SS type A sorting domain-containing protein, partial [Flavobacteriales bacterium]|nr:T9SS type A sorting domain-containing protein [Flavobacteriales bacterium]
NNCNAVESVTVTEPSTTVTASISANNTVSCIGGNDGSITAAGSGGNGGAFTFLWDDGATQITATATGLMAGNYAVTVTDVTGNCSDIVTVTLAEPTAITITASTTDPNCFVGSDGAIDATVTGGTTGTGYSYNWIGTDAITASEDQTGLSDGSYNVTVTDGNGCTQTDSYTLNQPATVTLTASVTSNFNGADISCNGLSDATATVSASGGNATFTYLWDNGDNTLNATNLNAGIHTVTVQDNGYCNYTADITVTEPNILAGNPTTNLINGSDVSCPGSTDGNVTLAPSGGTGAYTYAWSTTPGQTTITGTGLYAGPVFKATITDINGCTKIENIILSNPPILTLTTAITSNYNGEDISCLGGSNGAGSAVLAGGTVGGGYTYNWDTSPIQNTSVSSGLSAGTYNVTATDGNGCSTTGSIVLADPTLLSVATSTTVSYNGFDVSCNGASDGAIQTAITSVGTVGTGYSYAWSSGQSTANLAGVPADVYTVSLTDGNGCVTTSSYTLSEPTAIVLSTSITSAYGAANSETTCSYSSDGSAAVVANGGTLTGYTYNWSNTETTAATSANLASGTHTVTVTDANSCTQTAIITITPASVIVSGKTQTNVSVAGSSTGQASVLPSGGQSDYTYLWTNVAGVITGANETNSGITNMPAGTYNMTITDANGCTLPVVFIITENASLDGGSITHVDAGGAILNVCENDVAVTNILQDAGAANAGAPSGGDGVYSFAWEFSTDFVTWSTLIPVVTSSSYTNTFDVTITQVIRRIVTDGAGAIAYSNSMILLSVDTTTTLSFMPSSFCDNDGDTTALLVSPSDNLATWIFNDLTTPANITLTTNSDGTGEFVPNDFIAGNHSITHTYTNGDGCTSTLVTPVTINSPTLVSFTGTPTVHSIGSPPLVLDAAQVSIFSTNTDTSNFTGPYVSYDGTNYEYNPSAAGNHTIEYIYINQYGCSDTTTHPISAQNQDATILVEGSADQIGTHLCMTDNSFSIVCDPGGSNISYAGNPSIVIVNENDGSTIVSTTGDTYALSRALLDQGGGTYTIYYTYVTSADGVTPQDTLILSSPFDFIDNYNIDFYVDPTYGTDDFEFCHNTASRDFRAHYTFSPFNLVGLGVYTSSFGSTNLDETGSALANNGQVTYTPTDTITSPLDTVTYQYTLQPSGCLISVKHEIVVYALPDLVLTRSISTDSLFCNYETDTITPNIPSGTFTSASSSYITQIADLDFWLFDILPGFQSTDSSNQANPTSADNYTSDLCSDGYYPTDAGVSKNFRSKKFNMPNATGTFSSADLSLYYTDCSPDATFDIYINGNFIVTINSLGSSCTCNPNGTTAPSYPHTVNISGALLDPFWNVSNSTLNNTFTIVINGVSGTLYFSGATIHLNSSASGGTYGFFNASAATAGVNDVTYEYTDGNGCFNSVSMDLVVLEQPTVNFALNPLYNILDLADSIFVTTPDTIAFDTLYYSGPGLTAGLSYVIDNTVNIFGISNNDTIFTGFDPATAGLGTHGINYNYTDTNLCSFVITDSIIVQEASGTFTTVDSNYCEGSPWQGIAVSVSNSNGADGLFHGRGVSDPISTPLWGKFSAMAAGVGGDTIYYTYLGFDGLTKFTIDTIINVSSLPSISFSVDTLLNVTQSTAYDLSVSVTPYSSNSDTSYFTFDVSGVPTESSSFFPSIVGIGNHTITYTYTDNLGCTNTAIDAIEVDTARGTFFGLPLSDYYCVNEALDTIWAVPENSDGNDGIYSGSGITNIAGLDSAEFDPTSIPSGTYTISYTYMGFDGSTPFTIDTFLILADLPIVTFTIDPLYNILEQSDTLNALPSGGFYTGASISDSVFYPNIAGIDTHQVSYTYTDTNGCTAIVIDSTIVQEASGTFFGIPANNHYCIDAQLDTIWAAVTNSNGLEGIYSGVGVTDVILIDTATFYASVNGAGSVTITYSYYGFDNTTLFTIDTTIIVAPLPVLSFDMDTLFNVIESPYALSANSTDMGNIDSSYFSGTGINGTSFEPVTAGVGNYTITYTYVDTIGCTNFITDHTIVQRSTGSFYGIPNNNYYCYDGTIDTIWAVAPNIDSTQVGWYTGTSALTDINGASFTDSATYLPSINTIVTANTTINDTITYNYFGFDNTTLFSFDTVIQVINIGAIGILNINAEYCIDTEADTLIGFPLFTSGTGVFDPFTGFNPAPFAGDSATLSPALMGSGTHDILYTFTDNASNCARDTTISVIVYELPVVGITMETIGTDLSAGSYCISEDSVAISGIVGGLLAAAGDFLGNGIFNNTSNGIAAYNPSIVGAQGTDETIDTIWFEYTDPSTGCYNNTFVETKSYSLPDPEITNLDSLYCNNAVPVFLNGANNMGYGPNNTNAELWAINSLFFGQDNELDPASDSSGVWRVNYTYTDNKGCVNTINDSTIIAPLPIVGWDVVNRCIANPIQFMDTTYIDNTLGDYIVYWDWNFGAAGVADTSHLANPTYQYTTTSSVEIYLYVETNNGCSSFIEEFLTGLGDIPPINFTWLNECDGDTVLFTVDPATASFTGVDFYEWDFDDGTYVGDSLLSTAQNHSYSSVQPYNVQFTVSTESGCVDSITKTINVRPFYTPTSTSPYTTDFETGKDGWLAEPAGLSSWEFGTPNNTLINSAYSGNSAWVTGIDTSYYDAENSWIAGPCYDLSQLQRPMIKIWVNTATQENDGAVLQSTTDEGQTWQNVGAVNTGINWFNLNGLEGSPGEQSIAQGNVGWSDTTVAWMEARHSLDNLLNQTNVRFRIAFGANLTQGTSAEGIAFDNIWIGDKERLVLLEHFTNAGISSAGVAYDAAVNSIVSNNPNDVIDIQYHTKFPSDDILNADNPADPSTRVLYYGITNTPYSHMDGNQYSGAAWTQQDLDFRVLQDPQFDIDLSTNVGGTDIQITAKIISRNNLDSSDITLHIAVVESNINLSGTNYSSVLKALLPDAAGTNYERTWNTGESSTVTETYDLRNLYDERLFEVIAFVQNNTTKEVYQVAYNDTAQLSSSVIVEQIVDELNFDFALFPNPTRDNATILIGDEVVGDIQVTVYNQMGQVVFNQLLNSGTSKTLIELGNHPSGVYFVQLNSGSQNLGVKKLVVNK